MGNCYCLKNASSQNPSGLKTVFDLEEDNKKEVNNLNESYPEYEANTLKKREANLNNIQKSKGSPVGKNKNVDNYNEKKIECYTDKKKQVFEPVDAEKTADLKNITKEKLEDTSDKVNNIDTITSLYNGNQQHPQQLNGMSNENRQENEKGKSSDCNNINNNQNNFNDINMNGNHNIISNNNDGINNTGMIVNSSTMKKNPILAKRLTEILKLKDISKNLKDKPNSINVVLLGDKCVGKTSIVYQYISNKFDQYYIQTIIKEEFSKVIAVNGKKYNINFTVTSGVREYQEDYTSLYKISDFFVVCYDVTNSASFEKAREIITNEILPYVFLYNDGYANIVLVGNKCDLKERAVDHVKVKEYCEKYRIDFYETSAKLKTNIAKIFNRIVDVYDEALNDITE